MVYKEVQETKMLDPPLVPVPPAEMLDGSLRRTAASMGPPCPLPSQRAGQGWRCAWVCFRVTSGGSAGTCWPLFRHRCEVCSQTEVRVFLWTQTLRSACYTRMPS